MSVKKSPLYIANTLWIGIPLAIVGGYLDAYTFIMHDGVFANAQTGNMVFLGLYFAQGQFSAAFSYLVPILAFAAGVFATEIMRRKRSAFWFLQWRHLVLAIEATILFAVGFFPAYIPHNFVIVLVSFVCAMQVNTFRKMHNSLYATTMCTGNLRSATEALSDTIYGYDPDSFGIFARYGIIILSFCGGAALGAVITRVLQYQSIWLCSAALFACIFILNTDRAGRLKNKKENENKERSCY